MWQETYSRRPAYNHLLCWDSERIFMGDRDSGPRHPCGRLDIYYTYLLQKLNKETGRQTCCRAPFFPALAQPVHQVYRAHLKPWVEEQWGWTLSPGCRLIPMCKLGGRSRGTFQLTGESQVQGRDISEWVLLILSLIKGMFSKACCKVAWDSRENRNFLSVCWPDFSYNNVVKLHETHLLPAEIWSQKYEPGHLQMWRPGWPAGIFIAMYYSLNWHVFFFISWNSKIAPHRIWWFLLYLTIVTTTTKD